MASRRFKLTAAASLVALGVAGYFLHSVFAVQGQGTLAQAPLNVQVQVPPAFIMALDDSGSMNWETLNNTRDGVYTWRTNSFFNASNTAWGYNDSPNGDHNRYIMLFPYPSRNNYQNSVPPVDIYGFARSPDFNPAYFDPRIVYEPWKNQDGTVFLNVDPVSAPVDPRPAGAPTGSATGGYNKLTRTFDLTSTVRERAADAAWGFRVHNGMVLPAGLTYYRPNDYCGNIPGPNGDWLTLDSDLVVSGVTSAGAFGAATNCRLGIEYFPATFYLKRASGDPVPTVDGYTATPTLVSGAQGLAAGEELYKFEIRPENYAPGAYDPAIQNFANYFTFYRTRREALTSALSNALLNVTNMRIGWFWINDRRPVTMRDMQDSSDRIAIYDDLRRLRASGSTPNRRAVDFMGQQFQRTNAGAPVQLSCQKNAGMLFTDGYINEEGNSPTPGNLDQPYGPPFADNSADTMADIVIPYYYNSLRPGMEQNAVPVPADCSAVPAPPALPPAHLRHLDCQTNLHMNFYGITLGTLGEQFGVNYLPDPINPSVITPDPYLNPPTWQARVDLHPRAVDEMWHATLNTRGEMINATTPADVTRAMRRILAAVGMGSSPSGSIAMTGARIGTGSLAVTPEYAVENEGTDWYSRLYAATVTANPLTGIVNFSNAWEASGRIPAEASRNIRFGIGSGTELFSTANVSLEMLCANPAGTSLCSSASFGTGPTQLDVSVDEAISYLRGDTDLEIQNGGKLRDRGSRLGNIVNSTPIVSAPTDDYGYRSLSGSSEATALASSYAGYLTSKRSDHNVMVYAGANDGMLHAFNGGMGADGVMDLTTNAGRERFAFIPQAVLGHMGNLLFPYVEADGIDQKFQHRYFVDGPMTVSDAYYTDASPNPWKTVLVGTAGAGGRSVFALNVSNASRSVGDSFTNSDYLWEINNLNTALPEDVRENIGHVLGRPVVVPVRTGASDISWKAIFGNGYNSQSGKAVLFVVDIATGTPTIRMIEANESSAPSGSNGLGNIVVLDRYGGPGQTTPGRDGFADTVYAADQKGAIWKFDLRSAATEVTTPLFVTQPLTTDTNYRQPITGGLTAAAGPAGGVMVYFGTGSFSFTSDPADASMQSLYGILDNDSGSTIPLSSLLPQTIESEYTATIPGDPDIEVLARNVSANPMQAGRLGWYLNLPAGERFVGYPRIESGIVFMPTYAPTVADGCSTQGFNFLFGLNALSGAASLSHVSIGSPGGGSPGVGTGALGLETGGTAPVRDVAVMSTPRLGTLPAGSDPDDLDDALAAQCSMVVQVAGAPPLYLPRACGRQSWRQLL